MRLIFDEYIMIDEIYISDGLLGVLLELIN